MSAKPSTTPPLSDLQKQHQHDVAHHTLRVQWLRGPDPRWGDGEPVSQGDLRMLTRQSESFLGGSGNSKHQCTCEPRCELPKEDAASQGQTPNQDREEVRFVYAMDVRAGDVLRFGNPISRVRVERTTQARSDGSIGLHGNNDTWSGFYQPQNRVRIVVSESAATRP
ncbi:hypothetical protein os4_37090 (plasmid) [Comamonadaceae bacterium OS-4]|nr:hypothetical protein os4_37090 [Comamonadaceae bacterium OS-4]